MTSYYIINQSDFSVTEVNDDSWFSNPINKEGKSHNLMCVLKTYGGYEAKYSLASKRNYYVLFYVRGIASDFTFNGWTFPKALHCCTESFSRDGRIFNKFSFICTMPNGQKLNVKVQVDKSYILGILESIKALINMSTTSFENDSYVIRGERHIFLNSYWYLNNIEKCHML